MVRLETLVQFFIDEVRRRQFSLEEELGPFRIRVFGVGFGAPVVYGPFVPCGEVVVDDVHQRGPSRVQQ